MSGASPSAPLSRLLYTSSMVAGAETSPEVIAAAAAARNAVNGLTGVLLFVEGTFIQVLEGPTDKLEATFERICCDFRHENLKLIDVDQVNQRRFDGWSMACLSDLDDTTVPLRGELADIRFLVGINAREAVAQMRQLLDASGETRKQRDPQPPPQKDAQRAPKRWGAARTTREPV